MVADIVGLFSEVLGGWNKPRGGSARKPVLVRTVRDTVPKAALPAPQTQGSGIDVRDTAVGVIGLYNQTPELAQSAHRMDQRAQEQVRTLDAMVQQTGAITGTLNSVVQSLDEATRDAFQSVKRIREITEGARILAINASIEAARAGTAGQAFTVVADEMQRLASQIEEASLHLGQTLGGMRSRVDDVVQVVGSNAQAQSGEENKSNSVAALTGAFQSINQQAREQQAEAHQVAEMSERARSISERLLLKVGRLRFGIHARSAKAVSSLVQAPEMSSVESGQIEPLLVKAAEAHSFFDLLYVTDRNGRQITRNVGQDDGAPDSGKEMVGKNWSSRPWFVAAAQQTGAVTSDLYLSVTTNRFCFTVSEAIRDADGSLLGVLGVDVDFERLLMIKK